MGPLLCDMPGIGAPYTSNTGAKGRARERKASAVFIIVWGWACLLGMMSVPTFAAPCNQTSTLIVEPGSGVNLEAVFNCEGGDFEVFWSGEVSVPGTIYIGTGTTVKIYGDSAAIAASGNRGLAVSSKESSSSGSGNSSTSSDQHAQRLEELSSGMSLPTDISAAAVGSGDSGGPLFQVNGGQIFLNSLAVRNGSADEGGGVHATSSNVTILDCVFENNFASDEGGGVYANLSVLTVANSTFRGNSAGFEPLPGDDDADGAGGGIATVDTAVLLDGSLFNDCYAGKEGGGLSHEFGRLSIVDSLFYNNRAGSESEEEEDAFGEGGAISLTACDRSFDGFLPACEMRDTTFSNNHVAKKGGAVIVSSGDGDGLSKVEFHRCVISNNTAGRDTLLDDPQGEGGAIVLGKKTHLLMADCLAEENKAGKKGGVLNLSGGDDWEETPGGSVILRNSTFTSNTGALNNAGVVTMNGFTNATVVGDGNVFEYNTCAQGGAVFGADFNSAITVEGGTFGSNTADIVTLDDVWSKGEQSGGVFWTKGELLILGGTFVNNAAKHGGVVQAAEDCSVVIEGGTFGGNTAENGGVVHVLIDGSLEVKGGVFEGNSARTGGGAFFVEGDTDIQITGGNFSSNEADFGGFLYKEGTGITTCTEATVLLHKGVDGGAIYAVDGATVEWECHLRNNSALVGPAIYARENANVTLRGLEASDNFVTRGSAIFVDKSTLSTHQVVISDGTDNVELSAVQTDTFSTYVAEETSFVGFVGEVVVFSEGRLYLDECNFSGSSAGVLVFAGQEEHTVIRNAVLGDNNYRSEAAEASDASRLPSAASFINPVDVRLRCDASPPPCSDGSWFLEGDLGVYCQRYQLRSSSDEVCAGGGVDALTLSSIEQPDATFYPNLLEGDLLLSLAPSSPSDTTSGTEDQSTTAASKSCSGTAGRVAWRVSGLWSSPSDSISTQEQDDWTVFPSTGLLLPGENATLRVVSKPGEGFNGVATVTFAADDIASLSSSSPVSSSSSLESDSGLEAKDSEETFDVEYYFCTAGSVWNSSQPEADANSTDACSLCTDLLQQDVEGVDCTSPGATTKNLPIKQGFWRAENDSVTVRKCFNEDACKGGTAVASVQEYCNEGYEGPLCAVCGAGYGTGVGNSCHACTTSFQGGMFFLVAVVFLLGLVLAVLLAVYLVGGKGAVSAKMSSTKGSVINLHRRGADLLARSESRKPRLDFREMEEDTSSVGGTGVTAATTASWPSGVESQVEKRNGRSSGSGQGAVGAGGSNNEARVERIGVLLSAVPLSKLKIVIVVWQISSAFAEITKVPFPPIYDKFLSIIGIFSFDLGWILSAACLTTSISFYDKVLIVTIGPLVPLCLLGLTFYVGSRPARQASPAETNPGLGGTAVSSQTHVEGGEQGSSSTRSAPWSSVRSILRARPGTQSSAVQEHLWGLFARHTTIMLIFLYLVYTQISTVVFQAFDCEDLAEIGKSYLRADLQIKCDTPSYQAYRVYAAVMIIIYPLGIPAVFLYFLVRQCSRINPATDKALKDLRGGQHVVHQNIIEREKDQNIAPTSFLWSAYLPKCYYYEVFECIRRLLLTGLLVFLVPDTPGQVAFSCLFAIFSLMTFELLRPHIHPLDIKLYRTGGLVILFTNFLGLVIKAGVASKDSSGSAVYSVALIAVNVMLFVSIWWNAWTTANATFSRSHAQDMLLGVDLVGEETIDKVLGPAKGRTGRLAGRTAGGGVEADDSEERPAWENVSALHSQHVSAFGGTGGGAGRMPLSAEVAPAFGGNMRLALKKIAPSSKNLSASEAPVRRVSVDRRLPTGGLLVPVSPTPGQQVLPTVSSSPEAK